VDIISKNDKLYPLKAKILTLSGYNSIIQSGRRTCGGADQNENHRAESRAGATGTV
jgi:hypothetical protein